MAVKIYRMTDRIPVQIGDLCVKIAPLSHIQKQEIASCLEIVKGDQFKDAAGASFLSVKFGVKDVCGAEYADGSKFELQFEDDKKNSLTDECCNELLNMEFKQEIMTTCMTFFKNITNKILHPITQKPMKGVKILPVEHLNSKKK